MDEQQKRTLTAEWQKLLAEAQRQTDMNAPHLKGQPFARFFTTSMLFHYASGVTVAQKAHRGEITRADQMFLHELTTQEVLMELGRMCAGLQADALLQELWRQLDHPQ